jgi:hypothetical protein
MTNLIFIDIDGVLNSEHFYHVTAYHTWDLLDPSCVSLLNKLTEERRAQLVLSSDWRKTYGIKKVKEVFKKNKVKGTVIGNISLKHNKEEGIKNYLLSLSKHLKDINYVVLDDKDLKINNLIQTNPKYGFDFKDYKQADKILSYEKDT